MLKTISLAMAISGVMSMPITAEQTWTGKISDSACNAKHQEAAENEGVMPDKECTEACVRGGSLYVLIADGKVFQIANQKNAGFAVASNQGVRSRRAENKTITISRIERVAE
jgi:tricorn protease-like protein